jgi:hypothetical protein
MQAENRTITGYRFTDRLERGIDRDGQVAKLVVDKTYVWSSFLGGIRQSIEYGGIQYVGHAVRRASGPLERRLRALARCL